MNKSVVIFLAGYGWPQARIGRKLNRTRSRVNQILKEIKIRKTSHCEVCEKPVERLFEVSVEKVVFLVCEGCKTELQDQI